MSALVSRLLSLLLVGLACPASQALDRVVLDAPANGIDRRNDYSTLLLTAILNKTKARYGAFNIDYAPEYLHRDRLLAELLAGKRLNVTAKATRPDWENSPLKVIRIPIDKGITEYRLFLIHRDDQEKFRQISTLEQLRQLTLGVGHAWSSRAVYQSQGFRVEPVVDWESLYRLISVRRIDYFPRALSEVFVEYEDRHATHPDMVIEDSLMLYFPLPKYFFISPQTPRLARRIEEGFKAMLADGSFEQLFMEYHQPLIARANFCQRRIFRIANPQLSAQTPLQRAEYWYAPPVIRAEGKQKSSCNN